MIVYLLKLFIPSWNELTKFGKLETKNYNLISIDNKLGWIIFYSFSCIMFFFTFFLNFPPSFGNVLHFLHSIRRLLESLFLTKFTKRKMHFINFFAGLLFYLMVPLSISISPKNIKIYNYLLIPLSLLINYFQFICHRSLANLKKYSIPFNFFFKYSTSPHYFFEICLYFIYFVISPSSLTFLMAFFVSFNLFHNSSMSYNWNIDKFGNDFLQLNRKILIPLIY